MVNSRPSVTRDFDYVEDAARALLTLARQAPGEGEAYNLASYVRCSLGELVDELLQACGSQAEVEFHGSVREGDPLRWEGSAQWARELGASFDTPLTEGLAGTVEWCMGESSYDRS